jgi:hypothetical protein
MYKQLKRPAALGEKIMIVKPREKRTHKPGDIMNVRLAYSNGSQGVYTHESQTFIYHDEYVVLFDISQHNITRQLIDYELMVLVDALDMKEQAEKQIVEAKARLVELQSALSALPKPV